MTSQELEEIEKRSFNDLQTCLKHAEHLRDKWREDYARWKEEQRRERAEQKMEHENRTT